ncbi:hypothetical protein PCC79_16175 [Propioniciclava soli]|uniref:Helix-turn-helix domain-containing protein n=1 Tax=Propioniciclava soli TaxID=2775081 RepID=A0ABZ3C6U9_9ACTN
MFNPVSYVSMVRASLRGDALKIATVLAGHADNEGEFDGAGRWLSRYVGEAAGLKPKEAEAAFSKLRSFGFVALVARGDSTIQRPARYALTGWSS